MSGTSSMRYQCANDIDKLKAIIVFDAISMFGTGKISSSMRTKIKGMQGSGGKNTFDISIYRNIDISINFDVPIYRNCSIFR